MSAPEETPPPRRRRTTLLALAVVVVAVLVVVGALLLGRTPAADVVTVDDAVAGLCIDVDDRGSDGLVLSERSCDDSHSAEIAYAGPVGDEAGLVEADGATQVCFERLDTDLRERLGRDAADFKLLALLEDPADVSAADTLVCYVQQASGEPLTAPLG